MGNMGACPMGPHTNEPSRGPHNITFFPKCTEKLSFPATNLSAMGQLHHNPYLVSLEKGPIANDAYDACDTYDLNIRLKYTGLSV